MAAQVRYMRFDERAVDAILDTTDSANLQPSGSSILRQQGQQVQTALSNTTPHMLPCLGHTPQEASAYVHPHNCAVAMMEF